MDTDLLTTFLELSRTRHFGRAAENLYLTQSAVSARIRLLEEQLGVVLFTRTRNDIQLTPAGARLMKYAESILNTLNRARQDVVMKAEDLESLAIGGMFSLWGIILHDWLVAVHRQWPEVALQAEAGNQDVLVRKLLDGALDLGFMWEPPQMAELEMEEMGRIRLVMVSTTPGLSAQQAVGPGYIMVDWGTGFTITHARHFPEMPTPALRVGMGRMALALMLAGGGSAYIAAPMAADHLAAGRLHRVAEAPPIDRAFHAVFPHAIVQRRGLIERTLALLRQMLGESEPARATVA
jgi:DNA-binding transcriptional LysR family regulator